MKFSKKLIALRHARGLSQNQLGEAIHVDPEYIHGWENGMMTPDLQQLTKLSDFFGLPLDTLIKGLETRDCDANQHCLDPVPHPAPANSDRRRVITQMEILSGSVASVFLLTTIVYLVSTMF